MSVDMDLAYPVFELYPRLLLFVDRHVKILSDRGDAIQPFSRHPIEERVRLRDALAANLHLIDAYIEADPDGLNQEELEIVRGWKDLIWGEFFVYKCLKAHNIFMTTDDPPVVYAVQSSLTPLGELIGDRLPHLCRTILLPLKGKIVYDGLLVGQNVFFGKGVQGRLKASYDEAKRRGDIVTTIPVRDAGRTPAVAGSPRRKKKGLKVAKGPAPSQSISAEADAAYREIVHLIDVFCAQYLDDEYAAMCRRLAALLAHINPCPLVKGKPVSWASGIVRVIGGTNFLGDPSMPHSMTMAEVDRRFGVSEATGASKAAAIRKIVDIARFDPEWTLPRLMDRNPLIWMFDVDGMILDARDAPRDVQQELFRRGMIPYIPGERP